MGDPVTPTFDGVRDRLDERVALIEAHLDAGIAAFRAEFTFYVRAQRMLMFVLWLAAVVPVGWLIVALGKGWF